MNRIARFVTERVGTAWAVLALLVAMAAYGGGEIARNNREAVRLSLLQTEVERRAIEITSQTLTGNLMGALGLLGMSDLALKQEARGEIPPNGKEVSRLMEHIARALDAEGAFVVGRDGIIKSSWAPGKSSTGQDVKFRPYVQMALQGQQSVYAAIGTTTGKRTLYFASPLHDGETNDSPVIGAVVGRGGVDHIDALLTGKNDFALLLSPQDVVFAGNRQEWIGHIVGEASAERIKAIRDLKQFGKMFDDREPRILPLSPGTGVRTFRDKRHVVARAPVKWNDPAGDWTLLMLEDVGRTVPGEELLPVRLLSGFVMLVLGLMGLHALRGHHRQRISARQLAAIAQAQEADTARKAALAAAALRLQQAESRDLLLQLFFKEAHAMFGILQGVVYVHKPGTTSMRLAGSYACATPPPAALSLGEGLLGQCAVERRPRIIATSTPEFGTIRSGLGEAVPAALLLAPIMLTDELLGVLEVAFLSLPGARDQEQFAELTGLLAMNLEILGRTFQAEKTLSATMAAARADAEQLAFQQVLVDTIPYPVFYKGPDTRFLGFNRAYEETFQVKRDDLIGKRVLDLDYLPETDRIAYQAEDEATIASAGMVRHTMKIPFADGRLHDTLYFVSGFRRPDGSPGGLVGTFIDLGPAKDDNTASPSGVHDDQEART